MIQLIFNLIINLLSTLVQVVLAPINLIIANALPDISDKMLFISNNMNIFFGNVSWAIGLIPEVLQETLLFIILVEIAKYTIFNSTHALLKIWNLFQKLKFW